MYQVLNISNNIQIDITPLVGSINWRSNINELGQQLTFDIAFNDDRYFPVNPVDLGNLIILKNEEEILRAIVVSEQRNGRGRIEYSCFDYAFYLNKSKAVYQFNKVRGKKAIETILNDFKVSIGNIVPIPIITNKIYNNWVVSDIIKNILGMDKDITKTQYRMEMRQGKLYIENQEELMIKGTFRLSENIQPYDITSAISSPSRKRSIEEMKNSIQIVSDDHVVVNLPKDKLIEKYGLLQEVISAEKKDIAQAKNMAKNKLDELAKIFEENSIEMIGNDQVRAGRTIEIKEPVTGMNGKYLIKDVNHTVKNGIHKMQLGLGVI
ncbi:XkdQ/YqbQ family protein [Marinisporobacter balticus]|uniref:YqbQ/XkdQ domain-containing protein n=1 Tax=Marinisporobacter balticus TaxID=2018667 RepID=A0A4R2KYN2_9FIRM|nr:hypothetical protein [Marinisporobacter balticus]TCO78017.1 hypothetical protein EV214_105116 [Marinisporobacter balticus]